MAKYLCIVTYIAEGLKGLMAKGGTARVEAARRFVANASGSVDGFYFALGADDAYADLPDNIAAAADGHVGGHGHSGQPDGAAADSRRGRPRGGCQTVVRRSRLLTRASRTGHDHAAERLGRPDRTHGQ